MPFFRCALSTAPTDTSADCQQALRAGNMPTTAAHAVVIVHKHLASSPNHPATPCCPNLSPARSLGEKTQPEGEAQAQQG
jgi:hypothetical protein